MKKFEEQEFKKGDKVVAHSKSVWGESLEDSTVWQQAKRAGQDYLYFIRYYDGTIRGGRFNGAVVLGLNEDSIAGDFFLESDIERYSELKGATEELDLKYKVVGIKIKEKIWELAELQLEQEEILKQKEEILEQSSTLGKKAVAEEYLSSKIIDGQVEANGEYVHGVNTKPYFTVKEKKSVVNLVLKGLSTGKIYQKTQSKCMATDEFSIEVGKAICLARALGDKKIEEQLIK